ncbi:WD40 repeat domain-containing protein [Streptomyces sp. NPDC003016]
MIRHQGPISGVAAYGGRYVVTAGYDNRVILWDAARHTPLAQSVHDHLANQASFSPDGRFLVTSSSDYTARLWSIPDLKLLAVFSEHKDDVEMSVFHPEQPLLATASRDHVVRVFDYSGGLVHSFEGHAADVISVEWLPQSGELLSSSDDGTIKRWSLESDGLVETIDLDGVETDTIAITRGGVVFAGNDDGAIIRIEGDRREFTPAHDAGIKRLVYNAATESLVSLSYDRSLRIWNTVDGGLELSHTTEFPAEVWARSCAFIDEHTLAFATFGSTYATYDIGSATWDVSRVRETPCVNAVAAVRDEQTYTVGDSGVVSVDGQAVARMGSLCNFLVRAGDRVLTGGQLGRIFDADTGDVLYQHRSPLNCAASFTREGVPHVVFGAYTGEGLVFALRGGGAFDHVATLELHANAVKGISVSDGVIFAVSADAGAGWFDTRTLREVARRQEAHDRIANGCAALPGGRFVSISRDRTLRIWQGQEATVVPTPHDHSIKCVAASPDGSLIATGSYAGMVAVYAPASGEWVRVEKPTTAGVSCLHYDTFGERFLAASYDGSVYEVSA